MKRVNSFEKSIIRVLFILILSTSLNFNLKSQNIVITDDDGYTVDASAMLDVKSITKGLLIPRLTSDERNAIVSPAQGLLVFDTDEAAFYYFEDIEWVNLSKGQVWTVNSDYVILSNEIGRVGIGTSTPNSKLEVKADASFTESDTLFAVKDKNGNIVFAVFPDGAKVYVNEGAKGTVGGFAVSGRNPAKATVEENYLKVTPDSTRIWVNEASKGTVGGFAVSGRNPAKSTVLNYFVSTADSTRIYINDTSATKGTVGGFAVSGRNPAKGVRNDYFISTADSTRIYINDTVSTKGTVGGFAVSGRNPAKGITGNYMQISKDSIRMYIEEGATSKGTVGGFAVSGRNPAKGGITNDYFNVSGNATATEINNQARVMWYPQKAALLAGEVHVGSADSVGTNSTALGYHSISKGEYSQAMGYETFAEGDYSQAMGYKAQALGINSTAIGNYAIASAANSFALGDSAIAEGIGSYAIGSVGRDTTGASTGNPAKAYGDYSFAFGLGTLADTTSAFAFGSNTTASGVASTAFGYETEATGQYSIAGGYNSNAWGKSSVSLGQNNTSGKWAVTIGTDLAATAQESVAIGSQNFSEGIGDITIGSGNDINSGRAVAIGSGNICRTGYAAFALGYTNTGNGSRSFILGNNNTTNGDYSFAIGSFNTTIGTSAMAFGYETTASGHYSTTFGRGIEAAGLYTMAIALDDEIGTTITQDNTMAIMGGNVGIGTIAPAYTLDIAGDLNLNSGISSGPALNVNGAEAIWYNGTYFSWGFGASGNYFADNVGIGTSTFTYPLNVAGTANLNSGITSATALRVNGAEALYYNGSRFTWGTGGSHNYFPDLVSIGVSSTTHALVVKSAGDVSRIWRSTDGILLQFTTGLSLPTNRGSISVSGATVSYNAFTGSHYTNIEGEKEKGMLMSLTGNNSYIDDDSGSEIIYGVKMASEENSKNIIGAFLGTIDSDNDTYDLVMAVGNGVMWIVDNGENLEIGDYLISSSVAGHAMKDKGEFEVSNIVARVAEPVNWTNETALINGVKHKLISVFFENFKLNNSIDELILEKQISTQDIEIKKLKDKLDQQEKTNQELLERLELIEERSNKK